MTSIAIPPYVEYAARSLLALSPVFLDTETSGLRPTDEIAEIAIIDTDGTTLFESLVRPQQPMDPEAVAVHGLTDESLADCPTWAEISDTVSAILANRHVVAHCASFDADMLRQTAERAGVPPANAAAFECTMQLLLPLQPHRPRLSLKRAMALIGISGEGLPGKAHRAAYDAHCCRRLLFAAAGVPLAA